MVERNHRVLVVDDEVAIREVLTQMLQGEGISVGTAASAEEALECISSGAAVDLVLTDLRMPGMGGEELALRIARDHPEIAVAIMTGYPSLDTAKSAVRAQVIDYIEKPFDGPEDPRTRVRRLLEEHDRKRTRLATLEKLEARTRELEAEKDILTRKIGVTQRNLREQMRSLRKSREIFYSDLSRVMAILDSLVDGIVFTDSESKVVLVNPAAGKMLGLPTFTVVGRSIGRLEGNRVLLSLLAAHRAMVLDEDGAEAEITTPGSGRKEHYTVHSSPIPDFEGKPSGILSLIRDVSLRKKTEHLKNQFLSIVAHELRTPLTTIKAFATILEKGIYGELSDDQRPLVGNILSQSDRLGHEIDKVISLGRLEASDFAPDLHDVAVSQILSKIPAPFESDKAEKKIELTVLDESDGARIHADGRDLQRALRALVENAMKFTPEGGWVQVHARATEAQVEFEVRDSGIGIDPKDQEVIFERFIQLENPLTRKYGGSGLGLSFVAEIMKAHGTRIEVESQVGKGATFRFRLPRLRRRVEAGATSGEAARANNPQP